MQRAESPRLLVGAALVAWAVAGLPQVANWASGHAPFDGTSALWVAAYGTFAITFLFVTASERSVVLRVTGLALQSAMALVVVALGSTGFEGMLLCVIAGEAPFVLGEATGLVWMVTQTIAMATIDVASPFHTHRHVISTLAYAAFQLFAFGASRLAVREAAARVELARVHAELLATGELLTDSTRTAERLRIARELHDALGHHLTALSLQLELARNLTDGMAKKSVDSAHTVTRALLSDLRSVVSTLREDPELQLSSALHTLVDGIPFPRVHLDVDSDFRVDAASAHAIFRCVQEALTNAIRHARAQNIYLALETKAGTVTVTARDDGRGTAEVRLGHGLSGLRERMEAMGGKIEIEARQGAGLTLRAFLPSAARFR